MIDSVFADIKRTFSQGNALTRVIIANIIVFMVINLVYVFTYHAGAGQPSAFYQSFRSFFVLPSDGGQFLRRFWTLVTYMFTHERFFHLLWNMLLLYWFGRILGDFIGDRRILPIYILGGIAGGMFFMLMDNLLPTGTHGSAFVLGASGAVMAIMVATATLSPDYTLNLIFLGPVKIKYIVFVLFFLDIIGTAGSGNEGGHWAHLGGALFGLLYIVNLRKGNDWTTGLQRLFSTQVNIGAKAKSKTTPKTNLRVVHKDKAEPIADESKLNNILEKIKAKGYNSLSEEEKAFLNQVSNQ